MLHISALTYRLGERLLIDNATAALPSGAHVGLVGRNGAGKTTLFRVLRGELAPETGAIMVPKGARIGSVDQEAPAGAESLVDFVLSADVEREALMSEAETANDPERIAEIHTRLVDIEAHNAPARAARILQGLGFDEAAQARSLGEFSGGWRMRVALAAVLFSEPDLLLLDEPTNYLDLEGVLWLTDYLKTCPATILVISHDRDLLDDVAQQILHLDRGKLTYGAAATRASNASATSSKSLPARQPRSRRRSAPICRLSSTVSAPRRRRRCRPSRDSRCWPRWRRSRRSSTTPCCRSNGPRSSNA